MATGNPHRPEISCLPSRPRMSNRSNDRTNDQRRAPILGIVSNCLTTRQLRRRSGQRTRSISVWRLIRQRPGHNRLSASLNANDQERSIPLGWLTSFLIGRKSQRQFANPEISDSAISRFPGRSSRRREQARPSEIHGWGPRKRPLSRPRGTDCLLLQCDGIAVPAKRDNLAGAFVANVNLPR
jgi:hypothetical protein